MTARRTLARWAPSQTMTAPRDDGSEIGCVFRFRNDGRFLRGLRGGKDRRLLARILGLPCVGLKNQRLAFPAREHHLHAANAFDRLQERSEPRLVILRLRFERCRLRVSRLRFSFAGRPRKQHRAERQ